MIKNDETLDIVFRVGDKNNDGVLTVKEFTSMFTKYMKAEDASVLFSAVDIDKSHDITIGELRSELAIVNAGVIMH